MDALQSQSLQVELRERMEQFNQYWISSQQQYAEMQWGLLHTIQQLQLELTEAKERSGAPKEGPQVSFVQSIANSVASNGSATADGNQQLKNNGTGDVSIKGNNASAVPIPTSLLGISGYAPPGHIAGLHSYMIHQGIPQPLASPNSGVPQFGSFQSQSTIQPNLHWANQQEVQNVSQPQDETNYQPSQSDQTALQPAAINTDELSSKPSQASHRDHLNAHGKQQQSPASVLAESTHELTKTSQSQVVESNVAEHAVYGEQQKAFKEQDSPSNVNNRTGMVEHQEQKTESKDERAASDKQPDPVPRQQQKPSKFSTATPQLHFKNNAAEFNPNVVNQSAERPKLYLDFVKKKIEVARRLQLSPDEGTCRIGKY
ncbi:hypothetical protein SETIT_6G030600v2 [Setaria italica]|uniref:Uncharacterized protein n=1 Tax=Setaria italica TaxID=4555 RepID=A0A368RHI3_SETIT|nr:uncharacterized protein LOC101762489 [Setaria italica]RCV29669.1 hypothetical protein SETIT_6G030600v2 [Setaria italica]